MIYKHYYFEPEEVSSKRFVLNSLLLFNNNNVIVVKLNDARMQSLNTILQSVALHSSRIKQQLFYSSIKFPGILVHTDGVWR